MQIATNVKQLSFGDKPNKNKDNLESAKFGCRLGKNGKIGSENEVIAGDPAAESTIINKPRFTSANSLIARILSYNLRIQRAGLGLSQLEVAEKCGISLRLYQSMESALANPTLASLDQVSRIFKITIGNLLRMQILYTKAAATEFKRIFNKHFCSEELPALLRSPEGNILYANTAAQSVLGIQDPSGLEKNLVELLTPPSKEVFESMLESEKLGLAQPHISFVQYNSDSIVPLKFYPVLIYPVRGSRPIFIATLLLPVSLDIEERYYSYCELLLNCIDPISKNETENF